MAPTRRDSRAFGELAPLLTGQLVLPEDAAYEEARHLWNGQVQTRPAALVRCATAQDVVHTHADAGDEASFTRRIEAAIEMLGHAGEGPDGSAKREFIPFEVFEIRGKVMREFGRPALALADYERADRALASRPSMPRWHALLTIGKAQALCDMGDLDQGVELAIRGITMAHACQSPRQMNRVRKLMRKLDASPQADAPALQPLRDIVREVYAGERDPLDWRPQHVM